MDNPKKAKKIENLLKEISEIVKCNVEINFVIQPYVDDYMAHQGSEEFSLPNQPTMKMTDVIESLNKENGHFDVYVDPLYLNKGVNEIIDILITTKDNKVIIVPISNKKTIKL